MCEFINIDTTDMVACKYPQVRNWETGRCKAPCRADQAVNPDTGKCVTKTFLKAAHIRGDLGTSEYRSALRDDGITRRDGRSRRSGGPRRLSYGTRDELSEYLGEDVDFTEFDYKEPRRYGRLGYSGYSRRDNAKDLRDMLVDDPDCYPRKRNLRTGRCKTPCPPGYAINPETLQCVTIEYLISIDLYDPWYEEDEEDYMAANLKWFPSTIQSEAAHDNADMKTLIRSSELGVGDLRTLRGIELAGTGPQLVGIYSRGSRVKCEQNVLRAIITSAQANCGLRNVKQVGVPSPVAAPPGVNVIPNPNPPPTLQELLNEAVLNAGMDYAFVTGLLMTAATIGQVFNAAGAAGRDTRLAVIDREGVFKFVIRHTGAGLNVPLPAVFTAAGNDKTKLAEALDRHWKDVVSVAYHPWDSQTSV